MRAKKILALSIIFLVSPLFAAPAPWYKWQSKVDGKVFCAQTSPGGGWKRLKGSYRDLRCQKPIQEKTKKPLQRIGSD